MAFKLGKYYLTRNNPRAILKYNAKLMDENYKLQQKIDEAIEKLYCWGEALDPDFQKEMLSILKEEEK